MAGGLLDPGSSGVILESMLSDVGPALGDFVSFLGRSWVNFGSIWSQVGPFGDHPGGRRYKNTEGRIGVPVL